jgi:hypothetical protein
MDHYRLLLIITFTLSYHLFFSFHSHFFKTREKKVILFIHALVSSCATLDSTLKSCDPVNKALEVSYTGGYIPIQQTDFVYIWHCLSHNYPRTTDKIWSRYFYYFHRQTHKHHILLYTIIQGAVDRHRERLLVVSQKLITEAHLNGQYMGVLYDW